MLFLSPDFAVSIAQSALAEIERKRFNAMPRDQQEFVLKKRETEATERIASALEHQRPNINSHHHYY